MSNLLLGLLAETFIHSGSGRNEGAIDLPVVREPATDFPYIPGSGLKGALRDYAETHEMPGIDQSFGKEGAEQAGGILISDARLLLLPVRSLSGSYKWLTCPLLLERLRRDMERVVINNSAVPTFSVPKGKYLGSGSDTLYLEERIFMRENGLPEGLINTIKPLILHSDTQNRITNQLIVVHDDDFTWFARYALSVQARNVLDENKTSKNLWYEESLPPDTVMYTILGERTQESGLNRLKETVRESPFLQTGGNETVGMGWFAMQEWNQTVSDAETGGVS